MDEDLSQPAGHGPAPARLPITDISQWVERFSLMAAALCTRFPSKAPELFAYQALIVRAERNYEGRRWVAYDRQFRREALARKDLNWSVTDTRLYSEAFTGRARTIARCQYCLQDDHSAARCPRDPNRIQVAWLSDTADWARFPPSPALAYSRPPLSGSREICRRFNDGRCKQPRCKYQHMCTQCQGSHPLISCPQRPAGPTSGRSRSPLRPAHKILPTPQGPLGPRF